MIPSNLRVIFSRFLILLAAYFFCRLIHLTWNWPVYAEIPIQQIALAFVHGLRFDTSIILITNAPWILLWLFLPQKIRQTSAFKWLDLGSFAVLNYVALGLNLVDVEFVNFMGKRMSIELLRIQEDIQRHSLSILGTYWYLTLLSIALAALLTWIAARVSAEAQEKRSWWQSALWTFATLIFIFTGIRGGYQVKPLHPMHAYFSTRHELGLLTLNTPFNLVKSPPRGRRERARYFELDSQAVDHLKEMTGLSRAPLGLAKKWNVVIILVESFSSEYAGAGNDYPGYTPFFDSLAKEAFFFKNNFANARRSIEGLPAVLCGLPALMDEPIITSDFSNNRFDCLPKILGRAGYSTYFLHGAHNGSMHFDTFSKIAGFENFVGLDEYPKTNPADLDPHWGVLDEPMLQYAAELMDKAKRPALISVFTLSSHHPYYIPPHLRGQFKKGTLEIHESMGYADYALKKFFETAKTKPWFNETIFVITGDHIQKSDQPKYSNILGWYKVPLLIYVPGLKNSNLQKPNPDRITQHIDIVPSVLDLLGVQNPDRLLVGQSVFDQGKPGRAYNYTSHTYWYLESDGLIEMVRDSREIRPFTHKGTFEVQAGTEFNPVYVKNLQSVIHYMNQGLLGNSLYNWRKASE